VEVLAASTRRGRKPFESPIWSDASFLYVLLLLLRHPQHEPSPLGRYVGRFLSLSVII
jgi:hypothetical protein